MSASANAPSDARLFDRLADEHAIFLELLCQYCVEEGIAAGIKWQYENGKNFCLLERNELKTERRCEREKGDRGPAKEIGEHEQSHAFRDPRVVRVPSLRASYRAIHLEVTTHQYEKSDSVDEHEKNDVAEGGRAARFKRKTYSELSIIRGSHQRQRRHRKSENPAHAHYVSRVFQREPLVEMHRVSYRVISLQGDDCQGINAQFRAEDSQETSKLTTR